MLNCAWPGWTCDEEIQKIKTDDDQARPTPRSASRSGSSRHKLFYEKVPVIRYGDLHGLRAARKKLKGFNEKTERPRFYNVWLDK